MGRGVEPHPPAGLTQRRGHERADAPLAVGSADVNGGHDLMGIAQRLEQGTRGPQPELDGGGAGKEKLQRLVVAERRFGYRCSAHFGEIDMRTLPLHMT
jgi:hypothetical protein